MKRFHIVTALLAFTFSSHSFAASWYECNGDSDKKIIWSSNSRTARINSTSFPGNALIAVKRGLDAASRNPSPFVINVATETGTVGSGNDENEVYSASISPPGKANQRMHCYWFVGWHYGMDEVDIVLDSTGRNWTSSTSKSSNFMYTWIYRPIDTCIIHEAGHFIGLMHVNWEYNVMGDNWQHHHTNGDTATTYFGEDASHGARVLYGNQSSTFNDVSVSHWRRTGANNEYSAHDRVRVRNSANTATLPAVLINGEPGYKVTLGTTVRPEFTIENNGKSSHNNVTYGIYISTNDYISYSDRRIGGGIFGKIHPADVATLTVPVDIPNDLNLGQNYWLGMIIDEHNDIAEVDGVNNRAYIPIRIQ